MPRRFVDTSPAGRAAARARIAEPARPLLRCELAELELGDDVLRVARRWRKVRWIIDHGLERLETLSLIATRWDEGAADDWITVLASREIGRRVIASACVPSVRRQLDELWDELNEFGAGTFRCGRFLLALTEGEGRPPRRRVAPLESA